MGPGDRRTHGSTQNSKFKTQNSEGTGPERLGEVLSRLFTARGWGRQQDRLRLERAWAEAAGPEIARQTQAGALRRGVLEVVVGNAVLLQELAHYHKRRLLEALRRRLPGTPLNDLRFRAGVIDKQD
jgi:predicted nucleic acid-binding Zn ribbon protein